MAKVTYDKKIAALLVVAPYNDFISEGGKIWDRLKGVAEANNCVPNMLQVLNTARATWSGSQIAASTGLKQAGAPGMCAVSPQMRRCTGAWRRAASEIDTSEQIGHRHCQLPATAAITVAAAGLVTIVAAATLAVTSPAFAQHTAHHKGPYALTPAPRAQVTVDRNDPALTGGGSLGYNQRVEQGY
jgi:hypothetical protein